MGMGFTMSDRYESQIGPLLEDAFARYGTRCLWNVRRPLPGDDVSLVVSSLKRNGDMGAWRLAGEIELAMSEDLDGAH